VNPTLIGSNQDGNGFVRYAAPAVQLQGGSYNGRIKVRVPSPFPYAYAQGSLPPFAHEIEPFKHMHESAPTAVALGENEPETFLNEMELSSETEVEEEQAPNFVNDVLTLQSLPDKKAQPERKRVYSEQYAKLGDPTCPTCKKLGLKKNWPIEYSPVNLNEIDRPLNEELHRRVNYLIDTPQAKRFSLTQKDLESASKQVFDATQRHIAVYDFGLQHKKQLLIPQYIQDEQKIVQLD